MAEDPNPSVIAALTFWAYIVAAVCLTCFIVTDIVGLRADLHHTASTKTNDDSRRFSMRSGKAQRWMYLSILSFVVSSYHMLSFLLVSYGEWSRKVPLDASGWMPIQDSIKHVWLWSKSSSLFLNFATALCETPARIFWTQQPLLLSSAWNSFMAVQGMRYQIPHLWAYYVLGQILPMSFSQNLFSTALLLSPPPPDNLVVSPTPNFQQWLLFVLLYFILLGVPIAAVSQYFVYSLFITRILLFAPYWSARKPVQRMRRGDSRTDGLPHYKNSPLSVALGFFLPVVQLPAAGYPLKLLQALNEDHAVSALGYDYLIGLASAWTLIDALRTTADTNHAVASDEHALADQEEVAET